MNLTELRNGIDDIDEKILELFSERMELCAKVAEYKKENGVSIYQENREAQIIRRVRNNSPAGLEDGASMLFYGLMDISRTMQNLSAGNSGEFIPLKKFLPKNVSKVACQGIKGSYSEEAAGKLFGKKPVIFYPSFEEVFEAVETGAAECGVLPIQNSNVGSVSQTYELMAVHNFFINSLIRVEITHCLAAKKGTALSDIKLVYSKNEALAQCSRFLKENGLERKEYENTAAAAKLVSESEENISACICSEECARLYGLEILSLNIADAAPNYTRFICFSNEPSLPADADTVSVSLSIPHSKGALYRLLTRFAVSGLNLVKIENKSVAGSDFEVIFYLDFTGSCSDPKVIALLNSLKSELNYFKFLGCFKEIV